MSSFIHKYLRYCGYILCILLAYIIQFTPFMIPIGGVYPTPLFLLVIVIAMHEHDLTASVFGLIAGLLTDVSVYNGHGLHALTYMLAGLACSLLIEILLQNNFLSLLFISTPLLLLHSIVEFLTKSTLTDGALQLYFRFYLASAFYSLVLVIPIYFVFRLIFRHGNRRQRLHGILPKKAERKQKIHRTSYSKKGL